jgi:serine/threonine protein kinase
MVVVVVEHGRAQSRATREFGYRHVVCDEGCRARVVAVQAWFSGVAVAVKPPVVAGKYTLLRRLGQGGMAEVFLAKQASEGGFEKLVVLKRILPHLAGGSDFTTMFLDEARVAADLRHPNIVTIVDTGRTGDSLFMVMEFLHGQDVRKLQRKVATFGQQIPFGHACQIVVDAAAGLHYAHTKKDLSGRPLHIVHRDVSPQNILVTFEGGTKIVDFGIAKAVGQSTHTSTGVLKGKYTYMSPEQAQGEVVDGRTDQYALGIVFWELLTMRRLYKRESESATLDAIVDGAVPRPRRFREDCPASLEEVVMTALARDKTARFRDCEELALALEDALARERIVHSPSRLSQYMRRLFADQLAEEAALGVVAPDGSLSIRNTFAPPRRADGADRVEPAVAPAVAPAKDDGGGARVDVTQADRRRAGSRSSEAEEAPRDRPDRDRERREPRDGDRSREERPARAKTETKEREPSRASREAERARPTTKVDAPLPPPAAAAASPASSSTAPTTRTGPASSRAAVVVAGIACAAVLGAVLVVGGGAGPAHLVVRSEPRGARVFLDGVDTQQTTPALLRGVQSGEPHKLHLELAGHTAVDEIVTIPKKGSTHEVKLDLAPQR